MNFDFDKEFPALAWAIKEAPNARRERWRRVVAARNLLVMLAVVLWMARGVMWLGMFVVESRGKIGTITESMDAHGAHCDRIYGGWFTSDTFDCVVYAPKEYPGRGDWDEVIHDKAFDDGLLGRCAGVQISTAKARWDEAKERRSRDAERTTSSIATVSVADKTALTLTTGTAVALPNLSDLDSRGRVTLTGDVTGTGMWIMPGVRR